MQSEKAESAQFPRWFEISLSTATPSLGKSQRTRAWGFQQGFGACSWDGTEATRGQLEKDRGEKRPWLLVGAIDVGRETRPPLMRSSAARTSTYSS